MPRSDECRRIYMAVDPQKVNERLAVTKERYRVITDRLWKIIDWKIDYLLNDGIGMPGNDDIIRAANTIVNLDIAILKNFVHHTT